MFERGSTDLRGERNYKLLTPSSILLVVATADRTSASLGRMAGVTLEIYNHSTPADTQILARAFNRDKDHGLLDALSKMKVAGHFSVAGTVGYDVRYIRESATSTGRQITFVTARPFRFGVSRDETCSQACNSIVGTLDLNDSNKSKSTGLLYPESKLVVNQEGQLQPDLAGRPMRLLDILDCKGSPDVDQRRVTELPAGRQHTLEEMNGGIARPHGLLSGR